MTLATLRSMNLGVAEVAKAFTLPTGEAASPAPAAAAAPEPLSAAAPAVPVTRKRPARARKSATPAPAAGLADPVQWWGALSQQFQHIAANALRETGQAATNSEAAHVPAAGVTARKAVKKRLKAKPAPKTPAGR
jgi:hypothetical protein